MGAAEEEEEEEAAADVSALQGDMACFGWLNSLSLIT